jgi:hypothetical protein
MPKCKSLILQGTPAHTSLQACKRAAINDGNAKEQGFILSKDHQIQKKRIKH